MVVVVGGRQLHTFGQKNHLEGRLLNKGGFVSPHSTKHVQQITATVRGCDDINDLWQSLSQSVQSFIQRSFIFSSPVFPLVTLSAFATWLQRVQISLGAPT